MFHRLFPRLNSQVQRKPRVEQCRQRGNPAMVAHQTAPNAFAVVDQDCGTVSHHRGSISTPYAAQAAFNSHSAKAQPLPADSPLARKLA
jgi:hypothetical protein